MIAKGLRVRFEARTGQVETLPFAPDGAFFGRPKLFDYRPASDCTDGAIAGVERVAEDFFAIKQFFSHPHPGGPWPQKTIATLLRCAGAPAPEWLIVSRNVWSFTPNSSRVAPTKALLTG